MSETGALSNLKGYVCAAFVAACAYKLLIWVHLGTLDALVGAAYGVIEGKPHWLAFQNRLLGPYLVLLIAQIGFTYAQAWKLYTGLLLLVQSLLIFHMLRTMRLSTSEAIQYLVVFLFSFLVLQNYWFYTWDSIDLILFTVFAYGIIRGKPTRFYVGLYLVGILNRESALFIAIFLTMDAFQFDMAQVSVKLVERSKLVLGSVLLVLGALYTKLIRHALFISNPAGQPDVDHELIGNHVYFASNVKDLLFNNFFNRNWIYSIAVLVALSYFAAKVRSYNDRQLKTFVMLLCLMANILVFGTFNETRMLFIVLPFMLFLWLSLQAKSDTYTRALAGRPSARKRTDQVRNAVAVE